MVDGERRPPARSPSTITLIVIVEIEVAEGGAQLCHHYFYNYMFKEVGTEERRAPLRSSVPTSLNIYFMKVVGWSGAELSSALQHQLLCHEILVVRGVWDERPKAALVPHPPHNKNYS